MKPYILTATGKKFWFDDPQPEQVCIEDIAWALSNLCRYTGHCRWFYSIAQHSVGASFIVPARFALEALLHDAAEAYITDLNAPLKYMPGAGRIQGDRSARREGHRREVRHQLPAVTDCEARGHADARTPSTAISCRRMTSRGRRSKA
jgi:hypothetical protein